MGLGRRHADYASGLALPLGNLLGLSGWGQPQTVGDGHPTWLSPIACYAACSPHNRAFPPPGVPRTVASPVVHAQAMATVYTMPSAALSPSSIFAITSTGICPILPSSLPRSPQCFVPIRRSQILDRSVFERLVEIRCRPCGLLCIRLYSLRDRCASSLFQPALDSLTPQLGRRSAKLFGDLAVSAFR